MENDPPIPNPAPTRALPLHDAIAVRAYQLWEGYGRPEGRDVEIWLEAERQLLGADGAVNNGAQGAVEARPLAEATSGGKRKRPRNAPELATNTGR
jgi:hypothetical protein